MNGSGSAVISLRGRSTRLSRGALLNSCAPFDQYDFWAVRGVGTVNFNTQSYPDSLAVVVVWSARS